MKTIFLVLSLLVPSFMNSYGDEKESSQKSAVGDKQRVEELEKQIKKLSQELRGLRKTELRITQEYKFSWADGDVSLLELFQDKEDLIVIHNMGKDCPYCTSYADGINGVLRHLEDRSAVVLLSPDTVAEQEKFAQGRGWKFKMVSTSKHGEKFNTDMDFYKPKEGVWPGFSVFHREGDKVTRVSFSSFDPGDEYCVLFPFILMLKDGSNGWYPKYEYKSPGSNEAKSK